MAAQAPADVAFEPDAKLVNISCFDMLLIELVPLAERMARAYEASLDRPDASSFHVDVDDGDGETGVQGTAHNGANHHDNFPRPDLVVL